jgi:hypothetical protein
VGRQVQFCSIENAKGKKPLQGLETTSPIICHLKLFLVFLSSHVHYTFQDYKKLWYNMEDLSYLPGNVIGRHDNGGKYLECDQMCQGVNESLLPDLKI